VGLKDITSVILPHFTKYPLVTQKQADFGLFKSVLRIRYISMTLLLSIKLKSF